MKPGDKVKCIDCGKQNVLQPDKIYTVVKLDGNDRVYIDEYKRYSFLKCRFVLVEKVIKIFKGRDNMIDLRKIISETPRSAYESIAKSLVEKAEQHLSIIIRSTPDREFWTTDHELKDMSKNAAKELFEYVKTEYIDRGLTQMTVQFVNELDHPTNYTPSKLRFSIRR